MHKKAFTITEILVVIVLLSIIATFGIPSYTKAIAKARERDATVQLTALHASCLVYYAQNGSYPVTTYSSASQINSAFRTNLIATDLTYAWTSGDGTSFTATATADTFVLRITNGQLEQGVNPCCSAGSCPSVPNC